MATRKSATKKSSAKKKSSARKKAPARKKSGTSKSSGPLIDVARKIGTTLGEVNVAVRNKISKLSGSEPSGDQ